MSGNETNSQSRAMGSVYLVGAGPGDPGLLTLRGAALLAQADVVVYDYLSNPRLLSHAPLAQSIYVGKNAASHTMTQAQINELLIAQAQLGKKVVRLKGGDPFVFGRGGEECEALAEAGVAFEVVPGITSAIAAAAYAGIPVTHRNLNSSFTLITGHEKEEPFRDEQAKARGMAAGSSDLDWPSIAKLPCMAFYMGAKSLGRISAKLIEHGKDPETPAATIQWGTTPRQRTVVSTLEGLPEAVASAKIGSPAITIIGQVVKLRETLNWFETRPLFGQTIVVTRTREQASELSTRLEALGANVLEAPTIELAPPKDMREVGEALKSAGSYDWVIFTSANGVASARRRLFEIALDSRVFQSAKIAAIGDATAKAINIELCRLVDLCPEEFVAEALADALEAKGPLNGKRFLLLRADIARPMLRERLRAAGATVDDVAVYQTLPARSLPEHVLTAMRAREVDWITFTSSSTATNLMKLLGDEAKELVKGLKLASIGPITSRTLVELNLPANVQASEYNIDGLVRAITAFGRTF